MKASYPGVARKVIRNRLWAQRGVVMASPSAALGGGLLWPLLGLARKAQSEGWVLRPSEPQLALPCLLAKAGLAGSRCPTTVALPGCLPSPSAALGAWVASVSAN